MFAGIRDLVGGRSAAYERELQKAKDLAISEMVERARTPEPTPSSASTSTTRPWAKMARC
jgi:hypothetical protein